MLLSSFIKRVYAEIERNEKINSSKMKQKQKQGEAEIFLQYEPPSSSQKDLPFPSGNCKRSNAKKAMSTPEAIAELKTLCKEEDPCLIYTDMVKIGEG